MMEQNRLLGNLFVYKKTAALLAAFQLGLFREIKEHGFDKDTCRRLGCNERYLALLCVYLANESYLAEVDGGWQLNKDFASQLDAFETICKHENSLYHKWLSPEQLALSVQSKTDDRLFDRVGFAPEEQSVYDNAMYGNNVSLIAFHLFRKLKRDRTSSLRYLEYGRSAGRIGQVLKRHIPDISIDVVSLNQAIDSQAAYDVIFVYNTVHYKTPTELGKILFQLKNSLAENGLVCIADVFYIENHAFQSTVLLDWITHGGVYNIYNQDVMEQLRSVGFDSVEQQSISSISTDMFFAYKKRRDDS